MQKKTSLFFAIFLASTLSGCTMRWFFIISNRSDETIQVKIKGWPTGAARDKFEPRMGDYKALKKTGWVKDKLPKADYELDVATNEIQIKLLAGTSVILDEMGDSKIMNIANSFDDTRVEIIASRGTTTYTGVEVRKAFNARKDFIYVLDYK